MSRVTGQNSLGRTKGNQQFELRLARDQLVHLETAAKLYASRPELRNLSSQKHIRLTRGNLNVLYLRAFNLAPKVGSPRSVTRSSIAVAS